MVSLRAFTVIFLAVITGATLGAGVTVWVLRESSLAEQMGFVSTETTATLLAAQKEQLESHSSESDSTLGQLLADQVSSERSESEQMQAMASRIDELTAQYAALSRDFESLRFRVDTHSKSFRPLQSGEVGEESRLRTLDTSSQ